MQNQKQNKKDEISESSTIEISRISIIQSTIKSQKTYYDRVRGKSSETKQLNIHMKTLNQKYLKKCALANQLNQKDKQIYHQYKTMRANFQSSKYLYESMTQQTKQMCRNYVRSSEMIRDILKSDRMFMNNKIIFLKFLKKVQSGIDKPNISWKQQYFKNKNPKKNEIQSNRSRQKKRQIKVKPQTQQNQQKKQQIKQFDNILSVRTIYTGGIGHGFNLLQQNKQLREKPTFGQAHFGGQLLFSINSNKIDV